MFHAKDGFSGLTAQIIVILSENVTFKGCCATDYISQIFVLRCPLDFLIVEKEF